ncbi:hypothetical protein L6452_03639 [Arctium lappa]|uniref:Uncharacterized protein n=1 Tax=Arctium lappa TaxID=4217 RepID=A0ACB9FND3_ARCLA|nr:hypothetical protein L6452_03639 [Arctium lappa]
MPLPASNQNVGFFFEFYISISCSPLPIDLEIAKTAKKLRKQAKLRKKQSDSTSSLVVNIWKDIELSTDLESDEEAVHFEEEKPHFEEEEPVTETEEE